VESRVLALPRRCYFERVAATAFVKSISADGPVSMWLPTMNPGVWKMRRERARFIFTMISSLISGAPMSLRNRSTFKPTLFAVLKITDSFSGPLYSMSALWNCAYLPCLTDARAALVAINEAGSRLEIP
jgi:hypothetical protein